MNQADHSEPHNADGKCVNPSCDNPSLDELGETWCESCDEYFRDKINIMQGIVEGALESGYEYNCDRCGFGFLIVHAGAIMPDEPECPECGGTEVLLTEIDETPMRLHPANQRRRE